MRVKFILCLSAVAAAGLAVSACRGDRGESSTVDATVEQAESELSTEAAVTAKKKAWEQVNRALQKHLAEGGTKDDERFRELEQERDQLEHEIKALLAESETPEQFRRQVEKQTKSVTKAERALQEYLGVGGSRDDGRYRALERQLQLQNQVLDALRIRLSELESSATSP